MEPGESYTLAVPIVLAKGAYFALVTFIGKKDGEYWQRMFRIEVPTPPASLGPGSKTGKLKGPKG
jgi:hypothetical protein